MGHRISSDRKEQCNQKMKENNKNEMRDTAKEHKSTVFKRDLT